MTISDPTLALHAFLVTRWEGEPVNAAPEELDELRWFRPSDLADLKLAHPASLSSILSAVQAAISPRIDDAAALALTGERTLPGIWHENYWFRRHEAAYRWVARSSPVRDATVVEAGIGEGYGGQLLSDAEAALVVGVDLDAPTLHHVAGRYPGVEPVRANLVALPLRDASADLVVSAQVVEHLWDQEGFVSECARVLRPGGRLVLTTPNRLTFPPGNPFHSRELDSDQLVALVAAELQVAGTYGLHHGPRLNAADREHGGLVDAQIATTPDLWPDVLRDVVTGVTAEDFVVGDKQDGLDLLVVGIRR
jgi:SAM-dependent methyltransferase